MNNLNSVLLEGNLVRDPDFKTLDSGTSLLVFSVALNRYYKGEDGYKKDVVFIDVDVWGKQASNCVDRLQKGSLVRVIGRLKQDIWENHEGKKVSKIKVVADHIEIKTLQSKQMNEASA
ncbi:MAG: single-stranded DNA-binding protein [Spirochaetales bacterium]|nr:single-stranded DNA-binding protein [Spirochaetales bacterium]